MRRLLNYIQNKKTSLFPDASTGESIPYQSMDSFRHVTEPKLTKSSKLKHLEQQCKAHIAETDSSMIRNNDQRNRRSKTSLSNTDLLLLFSNAFDLATKEIIAESILDIASLYINSNIAQDTKDAYQRYTDDYGAKHQFRKNNSELTIKIYQYLHTHADSLFEQLKNSPKLNDYIKLYHAIRQCCDTKDEELEQFYESLLNLGKRISQKQDPLEMEKYILFAFTHHPNRLVVFHPLFTKEYNYTNFIKCKFAAKINSLLLKNSILYQSAIQNLRLCLINKPEKHETELLSGSNTENELVIFDIFTSFYTNDFAQLRNQVSTLFKERPLTTETSVSYSNFLGFFLLENTAEIAEHFLNQITEISQLVPLINTSLNAYLSDHICFILGTSLRSSEFINMLSTSADESSEEPDSGLLKIHFVLANLINCSEFETAELLLSKCPKLTDEDSYHILKMVLSNSMIDLDIIKFLFRLNFNFYNTITLNGKNILPPFISIDFPSVSDYHQRLAKIRNGIMPNNRVCLDFLVENAPNQDYIENFITHAIETEQANILNYLFTQMQSPKMKELIKNKCYTDNMLQFKLSFFEHFFAQAVFYKRFSIANAFFAECHKDSSLSQRAIHAAIHSAVMDDSIEGLEYLNSLNCEKKYEPLRKNDFSGKTVYRIFEVNINPAFNIDGVILTALELALHHKKMMAANYLLIHAKHVVSFNQHGQLLDAAATDSRAVLSQYYNTLSSASLASDSSQSRTETSKPARASFLPPIYQKY
jgi:hypothetical protein